MISSVSCKKKTVANDPVPSIGFDRFTKTVISEFDDSVYLYINYTDGDADLGENDPDKKSLEIKRSDIPTSFGTNKQVSFCTQTKMTALARSIDSKGG